MNIWGRNIRLTIFGESHGDAVGLVIDGLPAGLILDQERISHDLSRRAPRKDKNHSTTRAETDSYDIVSGVYNGRTGGTPICVMFKNRDARSEDYKTPYIPRPSHADYAAYIKHNGYCDLRGGGHFSARLTTALVFLGAILRGELEKRGIYVGAHIAAIGDITDKRFDPIGVGREDILSLDPYFPLIDRTKKDDMDALLRDVREARDSIGGVVECAATGLPVGLGEPFFWSVESALSSLIFSIPAIKGIEFGCGFELSNMRGSSANDQFDKYSLNNPAKITHTNNAGGIIGGMTNGTPLIFRVVFKPIPTIGIPQTSVDLRRMEPVIAKSEGRHDVCAAVRGAVIVESAVCICLYDFLMSE